MSNEILNMKENAQYTRILFINNYFNKIMFQRFKIIFYQKYFKNNNK